jgi:hypothetical protein
MEVNNMKILLGALVAVTLLIGIAAAQPAEARCWWNGYEWQCWHPHHYWYRHHYWHPYGWYR